MAERRYSIERIAGLKPSQKRAVVLLACQGDDRINALAKYKKLKPPRLREIRNRFDYWIAGGRKDQWFNGWPNSQEYGSCFVFKWKERSQHQRLYGFLCHPLRDEDPGFQVCVLAFHAQKNERETDKTLLAKTSKLGEEETLRAAIKKVFEKD